MKKLQHQKNKNSSWQLFQPQSHRPKDQSATIWQPVAKGKCLFSNQLASGSCQLLRQVKSVAKRVLPCQPTHFKRCNFFSLNANILKFQLVQHFLQFHYCSEQLASVCRQVCNLHANCGQLLQSATKQSIHEVIVSAEPALLLVSPSDSQQPPASTFPNCRWSPAGLQASSSMYQ